MQREKYNSTIHILVCHVNQCLQKMRVPMEGKRHVNCIQAEQIIEVLELENL
jgi:hypothetical protein